LKPLVFACILIIGFGGMAVVVFKKMLMKSFGEISFSNMMDIGMWFRLIFNPWTIALLAFTFIFFAISLIAYSLEDASKVLVVSSGLAPLFFGLNILVTKYVLKETLSSNTTLAVFFIIASMIFGFLAVYFGGVKA